MKELNDEELQSLFENGKSFPSNEATEDEKAYRTLFEALDREPENGLPYDFSAKVTRRVQAKQKRGNELKYNLLAAAIFIAVIAVVCGSIAIASPTTTATMLQYKWVLLLVPIVFMAIQYFDQKLVKTRIFNNRSYKP